MTKTLGLKTPAVAMGHGFGTPRALCLYRYAEEFAQASYIIVVFDYRYFGESDGEPRQLLDIKQITLRVHRSGHFALYMEPEFTEIIAEQLEFLHRAVPLEQR
ncbi:hypothetical protein [uncultured Corynebacterium sp.]|uniref:hypothetical protein n=1 Tax=uncultured Corynebacterium sp. TaxID=159447 RepID=UPI00260F3AA8|nr:hypothetical protein [uncultured Corynebacterium sp.]